jgi:hypothetical protein
MLALFRGFEPRDWDVLVHEAARVVASATCANVSPIVANMSVSELRGYLRSRAARSAREQVHLSTAKVHLHPDQEADLTSAVVEQAVQLMIRDLTASPIAAIPTPHVRSRAA